MVLTPREQCDCTRTCSSCPAFGFPSKQSSERRGTRREFEKIDRSQKIRSEYATPRLPEPVTDRCKGEKILFARAHSVAWHGKPLLMHMRVLMDGAVARARNGKFFYGWYIVGASFFTRQRGVCVSPSPAPARPLQTPHRRPWSLPRRFFIAPLRRGPDRRGCRTPCGAARRPPRRAQTGAVIVGLGYLLLGHVESFAQFVLVRLSFVTLGDSLMGSMIVNIIVQWFLRRRGRALAVAGMGIGFAKVCMPVVAASLIVWLGWRQTWMIFGLAAAILGLGPVLIIRRSPEEMGPLPDGVQEPIILDQSGPKPKKFSADQIADQDLIWTRGEVMRTPTLLVTGDYLRHRQHGRYRAESACLSLCHRPWPFAGNRRYRHERDCFPQLRLRSPLSVGPPRRAHGRSSGGHAEVRDPSDRLRIGHLDEQSLLSLRRIFSLRHWLRR